MSNTSTDKSKNRGSRKNIINIINFAIRELNLFTNSKTNQKVIDRFDSDTYGEEIVNYVATSGIPKGHKECRQCMQNRPTSEFGYYQTRVNSEGYLMRSNALCINCKRSIDAERMKHFEDSDIPPRPKEGEICPRCNRKWTGNWHRHHTEEDGFIAWWCGNCNMSLQDQRTPTLRNSVE